jgi:RNA recognition motif-containing protein
MVQKLFVGGIPWKTTKEELQDAFSKAGEVVSASIVMDRETRESRGFGFVEMADEAAADSAIAMWNGKEFGGRMLKVDYARPKEANDNGGFRQAA